VIFGSEGKKGGDDSGKRKRGEGSRKICEGKNDAVLCQGKGETIFLSSESGGKGRKHIHVRTRLNGGGRREKRCLVNLRGNAGG